MSETHPCNDQSGQPYVTWDAFWDLVARVDVNEIDQRTQQRTTEHLRERITRLVRGDDSTGEVEPL
jgi:hypothetical protein